MTWPWLVILSVSLLAIVFQDLLSRSYVWWLAPLAALGVLGLSVYTIGWQDLLRTALVNLGVITCMCLAIYGYSAIRYRSWQSPFDRLLGWGDVVFLLVLALGMSTQVFLLFIVATSLLGIVLMLLSQLSDKLRLETFPFAGLQALVYLVLLAVVYDDGVMRLLEEPFVLDY